MSNTPHIATALVTPLTEACNGPASDPLQMEYEPVPLTFERRLAAQAMLLLIHLDRDLREARAQFNQDWFRRLMRARPKAVARIRRRWSKVAPAPRVRLGILCRRYHANLAMYLRSP